MTQFFPAPGKGKQTGGTISNLNFLRVLARQHDVLVLSFDPDSDPSLFGGESFQVIQRAAPPWRAPELFRQWLSFVRTEVREFLQKAGDPGLLLATTSSLAAFDVASEKTRCVSIVQAFENFGFRCPWVPLQTRINLGNLAVLNRFQDSRLLRQSDAVLTNSVFMKEAISGRFNISTDLIYVLQQQVDVTPSGGPAPEDTIGFVHRGPDKNIALVAELARRASDLRFLIYGHDSGLPVDLPVNIQRMGWSSDRNAMFASASLWLVPSLWAEPFGRVSIEAQAAERAVLVADHGGLPETVTDAQFRLAGFDPDRWVNRIRHLLQLPPEELVRNGALIRDKFSSMAHDAVIDNAVSKILATPRGLRHAV